jgi:hypothetical protein
MHTLEEIISKSIIKWICECKYLCRLCTARVVDTGCKYTTGRWCTFSCQYLQANFRENSKRDKIIRGPEEDDLFKKNLK